MPNKLINNSKTILPFAVLMVILHAVPAANSTETIEQKLAKAREYLNRGKAGSAASIARSVIASHPDNAAAHTVLGAALASLAGNDEYDAAIEEEKTALKLDSNSYWARKFLGQMYANLHKWPDAISVLDEACAIKPEAYAARRDLGVAQMSAGKNEDAIQTFKKAIQIDQTKADSHIKLSALMVKTDNYKEAIAEARKAVKLNVNNPESHLALANAILASGDKTGAIEHYENAIQANMSRAYRNPLTAASALSGLGWAFSVPNAGKKELAEASSYQRQAIKIFPPYGPAYIRLAELLSRQGKSKEAEALYKGSVKASQEDSSVSTAYAKFLAKSGRKDEARAVLKKVLEKTPEYKQASEVLSDLDNEKAG